jgi:hypothetical protein
MSKFSLVISTSASPATSGGPKVLLLFLVENAVKHIDLEQARTFHILFHFIWVPARASKDIGVITKGEEKKTNEKMK